MTGTPSSSGDIIIHVFGRTDVGRTREHNEDSFAVADLTRMNVSLQPEVRTHTLGDRGTMFVVADGMGGAAAGEVASAMATEVIVAELERRWHTSDSDDPEIFAHTLRAATEVANTKIHSYAQSNPENRGMGTTATIVGVLGDTLYVCQVGDSRAYLVRDGEAIQITKDQSLMQKLVEAGEITPEEAEVSERRNIILQALGPEPVVKVDLTSQQVKRDDVLILCSDGLSGQVRAHEIAEVVMQERDLVNVCKRLIDLANEAGGPDNITVIAARFEGSGLVDTGAETPAHRVYRGSQDLRPTVPLERDSISELRALDGDEQESPAAQPEISTDNRQKISADSSQNAPRVGPTGTKEMTPVPQAAVRPLMPPPPPPGGRISKMTLRILFGIIALIVLTVFVINWLGS